MSSNRLDCSIYEHKASSEDKKRLLNAAVFLLGRLWYKRTKKGYLCKCAKCGREYEVTSEILEQIKDSGKCFMCANTVKPIKGLQHDYAERREWLSIKNEKDAENGYEVMWKTTEGEPTITSCRHVLHRESGQTWLCGIQKTMGYLGTIWDPKKWLYWRKERPSYYEYLNFFSSVDDIEEDAKQTRKKFYQSVPLCDTLRHLKSNQQTFIRNGIFNENQILYIKLFDLNYSLDLAKHKKYIQYHACPEIDEKFNVHLLDYLDRTDQSIRIYCDYVQACRQLGEKPAKPADLQEAEQALLDKIEMANNAKMNQQIIERRSELEAKEFSKGAFAIHVFKDIEEMQSVGRKLKNCIGKMYVSPYAEKRTDVYYGTNEGKITFAFEINKNRLVQLRAFANKEVDLPTKEFVAEWCRRFNYVT